MKNSISDHTVAVLGRDSTQNYKESIPYLPGSNLVNETYFDCGFKGPSVKAMETR